VLTNRPGKTKSLRCRIEDGVLEPVWSRDAALPNSLVDLLDTCDREEEKEEEEESEEGRV